MLTSIFPIIIITFTLLPLPLLIYSYHPIPVVLSKGEGVHVWDMEGNKYYDFLSAYSAISQGHCHPRIVKALINQANKLTLSSRAFHNDILGKYAQYITQYFGYEMVFTEIDSHISKHDYYIIIFFRFCQ